LAPLFVWYYAARQKYGSQAFGSRGPAYFLEKYRLTESQAPAGVDGVGGVRYDPASAKRSHSSVG